MKLLALMFPLLVAAVRPSVYRPDNTLAVVRPDATLSVNDHAALIETFQDEFNKQKADSDCEEIQKGRRIPEIVRCSQGCSSQDVTSKIQKSPRVSPSMP